MNARHNTIKKAVGLSLLLGLAFSGVTASVLLQKIQHKYQKDEYVPEEGAYFVEEINDPTGLVKAHKFVTPTDNKYNSQKTRSLGTGLIGDIESVWSSYTGKGTKIAVIDDGFDYEHPEFTRSDGTSAILSTSRYYYASGNSAYYKSYSSDPTCIAEDWESDGQGGYEWATHGTATSTTAAAPMNNGGGVGIAPEADILALKIDFSFVAIKAAIQYAVAQGVDVINMSLGAYAESFTDGWGESQSGSSSTATYLNSVCQDAYNAGVIVVAAAGNESTWHKSYPACNTKVIGVGALGDWDNKGNANKLAEFTNYVKSNQTGEINVDILAPGYVYTAERQGTQSKPTHTYDDTQGTSFSCPIIAGAACLWKQKYPNGTPDQFLNQLQETADGIGYYTDKYIEVSGWDSSLSDAGPSAIENGRLNVANLLDINDPYVSTVQSNLSISIGERKQIDLDTYSGTITYSSNNTSIATVSSSGLVEGVGAGSTTITVTATKNGKTATTSVGVNVAAAVASTSIAFNPKTVTLTKGETYDSEATIEVSPSNASRIFMFDSSDDSIATVDEDTGLVTAVNSGTATISVISGYGDGYDELSVTVENATTSNGTIIFGNETGELNVNSTSVSGQDSLLNTWTVTTSGTSSFTPNADYSQIGSSKKPASSIQFVMSLSSSATFTSVSASFGGFSGTSASVAIKVGSTTIGTGSVPSSNDVTVTNSSTASGNSLTISLTDISKGIKAYSISYTCSASGGGGSSTPTITSVSVSPSTVNLDLNGTKTKTLTATVSGTNSPAQTVNWSTGNSAVATVSSAGLVTAVGTGTTTITATSTVDSGKSGTCTVTVTDSTPAPKVLSSISISGYKTTFKVGDTFSFGGTVTAHYDDSTSANVTSSATFTGYNMSTSGDQTVTVSFTHNGVTKTAQYSITVSKPSTTSATYTIGWGTATGTAGTYTNFAATSGSVTDLLSFTSNKGSAQNEPAYNSGSSELRLYYASGGNGGYITITPVEGVTFTGFVMEATSGYCPTVKYSVNGGSSTSISASNNKYTVNNISVSSSLKIQNANTSNTQLRILTIALTYEVPDESDKIVNSLSASYSGGDVYVGGSLDTSKVSVTASYTDSVKYPDAVLASTDYEISGFNNSTVGPKEVTVTYTGSLETSETPLTTKFSVSVIANPVTNVAVVDSKTYHPGETIAKSDITVTLTYKSGATNTTTDFTFDDDGYRFTYEDAASGGSNTSKQFSISYSGETYNFNVNVTRVAYQIVSASTTTLSSSEFNSSNLSKDSGTASPTSVTIGGVAFTVTTNAYAFYTNSTYYLSFGKTAGSIVNTNAFERDLTSVSVTQKTSGRQDGILTISKDGNNWISYSSSEIAKGGYRYFKYAYEGTGSGSGAAQYSNLETITFTLAAQDNAANVANYIMYNDTNGQCTTKLDIAVAKLNTMSSDDKSTFWTSEDYVIATARERLLAWAAHEHKTLTLTEGNFVLSSNNFLSTFKQMSSDNTATIVIIISLVTITAFGAFLFIRKKKEY